MLVIKRIPALTPGEQAGLQARYDDMAHAIRNGNGDAAVAETRGALRWFMQQHGIKRYELED